MIKNLILECPPPEPYLLFCFFSFAAFRLPAPK